MPKMTEHLDPGIRALGVEPVDLWHLWIVYILERLREHTTKDRYEEFLRDLSYILGRRTAQGEW